MGEREYPPKRGERDHHGVAYVGVSTEVDDGKPSLEIAFERATLLAAEDEGNHGKLFDLVRVQAVLSNPHVKEVRASIVQSDTT